MFGKKKTKDSKDSDKKEKAGKDKGKKKEPKTDKKSPSVLEGKTTGSEFSWVVKTSEDGSRIEEKVYKKQAPSSADKKPNGVLKKSGDGKKKKSSKSTHDVHFSDDSGQVHNSVVDVTNTLIYQKNGLKLDPRNGYNSPPAVTGAILRDASGNAIAVGKAGPPVHAPNGDLPHQRMVNSPGHVTSIRMPGMGVAGNRNSAGSAHQPHGGPSCQSCGAKNVVARAYSDPDTAAAQGAFNRSRAMVYQTLSQNDGAVVAEFNAPDNVTTHGLRRTSDQQQMTSQHYPGKADDQVQYAQLSFHKPNAAGGDPGGHNEPKLKGILKKRVEFNDTLDVAIVPNLTRHVSVESLWYPDPNVEAAKQAYAMDAFAAAYPTGPVIMDDTDLVTMRRRGKYTSAPRSHPILYETQPPRRSYIYDDALMTSRRPRYPSYDVGHAVRTAGHYPSRTVLVGGRMTADWY